MPDRMTANLPSRDFQTTADFYGRLGFEVTYRDEHWMLMKRGALEVEFFPHPELVPGESWFSACVRVARLDGLFASWSAARENFEGAGIATITPVTAFPPGMLSFKLIDCDGSLLRCLEEPRRSDTERSV